MANFFPETLRSTEAPLAVIYRVGYKHLAPPEPKLQGTLPRLEKQIARFRAERVRPQDVKTPDMRG